MSDNDKTKIMTGTVPASSTDNDRTKIIRPDDPQVGQLQIIDGPGKGAALAVYHGQNDIGRDGSARIRIDFGDETIGTRPSHLHCDAKTRAFVLSQGSYPNPIQVNGARLTEPKNLADGDRITIGRTTLRFTAV